MSGVRHAYEVVESDMAGVEAGGILVQAGHVRKYHEPYRRWDFLKSDGSLESVVGKHIGEYEKVKDYLPNREAQSDA